MLTDSFSGIAPSAVLFFIMVQLMAAWPIYKFSIWLTSSQNSDNQGNKLIPNTPPSLPMISAMILHPTTLVAFKHLITSIDYPSGYLD